MNISKSLIANLLRLTNGEPVSASSLRKDVAEALMREGLLTVRAQGSRRSYRAIDREALKAFVECNYVKMDLNGSLAAYAADNSVTRAELAATTGDSKLVSVRSCPGFPVNTYAPVKCQLNSKEITIFPPEGSFMFIADWRKFKIDSGVVVVGVENMENFRMLNRQRRLFDEMIGTDKPLLFVSRYPQSTDLRSWLQTIPNRYVHFGDFDLAGISIFLTEFRQYLGSRASFLIPSDLEERLRNGSVDRYNTQYPRFHNLQCHGIPELQTVIDMINKYHRCYDQEGYIE